jgi:CubicO group peptidase (beta-lactamase class C family)
MTRSLVLLVVFAAGCAAGCTSEPRPSWPEAEWPRAAPEAQGFDSDQLASLVDLIAASGAGAHSLTIVRRGVVILDVVFFPWDGARPHDIASITKSLAGTGVGMALATGSIASLEVPLVSLFPDRTIASLDDRKRMITLADALTMRAGLECVSSPSEATLLAMQASPDFVGFTLDLPMATAPGTAWSYCGPVSHVLSGVVTQATALPLDEYLRDQLFAPIGIGEVAAPRDPQGVSHGWGDWRMTPLDLARLGLLFERGGRWIDRQLLPASWVAEATRSHGDGYGYQWWSDADAFSARGRGGQYLYVHPGLELVIITSGSLGPEDEGRFGELLTTQLLPALRDPDQLPPNADAELRLAARVAAAGEPPAASAPPAVPAPWQAVAGERYTVVGASPLGWEEIAVTFAGDGGTIELTSRGAASTLAFGLDGVARISTARGLTTRPVVEVALVGRFVGDRTLALGFDTLADIDAGELTLDLDATGDQLTIDAFERTFLHGHVVFAATRSPDLGAAAQDTTP